jgi:RelB antitoxin
LNIAHVCYIVAQSMTTNSVVRARIDEADKAEASAVLAAMGLTLSDRFPHAGEADRQGKGAAVRTAGSERGNHRGDEGCAPRRADHRRPAGETAREPECGLLSTPAALAAITNASNRGVTAGAPIRHLLVIKAPGHARMPFARLRADHHAGIQGRGSCGQSRACG